MKRTIALLLLATAIRLTAQQYTKDGEFLLPKDYREWVFLSSGYATAYSAANGSNSNMLFHNVFVNPSAYRSFQKTGTWPDKTMILLELRKSEANVSIDKQGRVQTDVTAVEAHVKDSKASTKGGWSFYGVPIGSDKGKKFPADANCFTCHEQNGSTDSTFVQFYPTLIQAAKQHSNYKETGH